MEAATDQQKTTTEEQMDMMLMMDKFSEMYGSYFDLSPTTPPNHHEFISSSGATTTTTATAHNNNVMGGAAAAPPNNAIQCFIDRNHPAQFIPPPPSTISFATTSTNPLHDNSPPPFPALMSDSAAINMGRTWRVGDTDSQKKSASMAAMREMIFRIAAMQPVHIDPESVKPPKRRNVKISKDPQSVAARHRRERISEKIRILQRLVPGGTKMDTASMLDEAIHYVKFLKNQVQSLERAQVVSNRSGPGVGFPVAITSGSNYVSLGKLPYHQQLRCHQNAQNPSQLSE